MTEDLALHHRPPIGFVVEGDDEYHSYPSLVVGITGEHGFKIPRLNAGGCGAITRDLPAQLRDMTLAEHPYQILVTVDLIDVIRAGLYSNCAELLEDLSKQAADWLISAASDPRLQPLPLAVRIVIQIPKFESWLIADTDGFCGAVGQQLQNTIFADVDAEVPDPVKWIRSVFGPDVRIKNPRTVRRIVTKLDTSVMKARSRSFDKFYREVVSLYGEWCRVCGFTGLQS